MKAYLAHIVINLKLTLRDRVVLFFNYAFPLVFFFIFAQSFKADQSGAITQVATMVLIIGVLGNGFFGAGMRAVQDRELNILRRFKVAPISPGPILLSSLVTGWLNYLPSAVIILALSHFVYGMPLPRRLAALFVLLSVGIVAFRAVGLIIASVVNSLQESQILIQLLYLPMLFLSGATFPASSLPTWLQVIAQFMPATYLFTGMQGIMIRNEGLRGSAKPLLALVITTALALFVGARLFRWEKGEKVKASAKLWLAAVLAPFLILGSWQAYSRENLVKAKALYRQMARSRTMLIRDARIFTGDGTVIESGGVLIRNGRIAAIYQGRPPDARELRAHLIEASGKTLLPGLIDVHIHLSATGALTRPRPEPGYDIEHNMSRDLAAYLYTGVTAVRSVGDPIGIANRLRASVLSGERLGAELFVAGPIFTAEGGQGTEYFASLPDVVREAVTKHMVKIPKSVAEARAGVDELKLQGAQAVEVVLDSGRAGPSFNRLDIGLLKAMTSEARSLGLPVVVRTQDARGVADAVSAGADAIGHGSDRDAVPDAEFRRMAAEFVAYVPRLSAAEAFRDVAGGRPGLMERSLVQQVAPAALLEQTREFLASPEGDEVRRAFRRDPADTEMARNNLLRAHAAGVLLATGSDAGNPLVFHGPTVHREVQLLVESGIPPAAALQAATLNAARLLRAEDRIGRIAVGTEASLLLVDGNPLEDVAALERVSLVIFRGEPVDRSRLFEDAAAP